MWSKSTQSPAGEKVVTPASSWRNGTERFGLVSQAFHWATVLLIVGVVVLGLYSASLDRESATRGTVLTLHKSIGVGILGLTILRLGWILKSPAPPHAASLKRWEAASAWTAHKLLYLLLLAMPITGIVFSQAAGREVSFFGLFDIPQFISVDPSIPPGERPLVAAGALLHKTVLEYLLYLVVAAHVAGALKHRLIDRDRGAIRRMWGR